MTNNANAHRPTMFLHVTRADMRFRHNWIDAHNFISEIEFRREHLLNLIDTPVARELAREHRARATSMIDTIHEYALLAILPNL